MKICIPSDFDFSPPPFCAGCTGLLVAVAALNLDATIAFLQYGACPNIATNEGWSPLHQACWNFQHCESEADVNRNETIILALLHYGADPTSVCYLEGDYWEYSAVHLCALARHRNHCSQTIWLAICRVCGPQPLQQVAGEEAVTPYHLLQYGQPDVEAEAEEATFDSDNEAMEVEGRALFSDEVDESQHVNAYQYTYPQYNHGQR